MRVLQVGAGRWGRNHVRCWQRLAVELVVCDRDPRAREGLEVEWVADWRDALSRVDAVDVVTPAEAHADIAREALARGLDVLVEKPLAPQPEVAFELDALARARGAVLHVGHVFRFSPEARALADALRRGRIGRPRYLSGHFLGLKRPRTDGGVAISDAIHWIDLASWLLGRTPVAVSAVARDYFGRGMEDVALIDLDFGDEFAHVEASYFPPEPRRDLVVIGTEGALACDFLADAERVRLFGHAHARDDEGLWQVTHGDVETLALAPGEPLLEELSDFAEACRTRRPSRLAASGFDGAAAVAVVAAALRSARTGRRAEVKLPIPKQREAQESR
jgi:predicted dehydrogenase